MCFDHTRGDRDDFILEPAGLDRSQRALVTSQREGVLRLAGNARFSSVILGHQSRAQVHVWIGVHQRRIGGDLVAAHRHEAHRLGAAGDDGRCETAHDALCAVRNRLKTRRAEPVDRDRGRADRNAGAQAGDARDVHPLFGLRHRAPQDHVVHVRGGQPRRARERGLDRDCCQFVGPGAPQRAIRRFSNGGTRRRYDDGFSHANLPASPRRRQRLRPPCRRTDDPRRRSRRALLARRRARRTRAFP